MLSGPGGDVCVSSTTLPVQFYPSPDLSKLRLIKESELRRGGIIGSGAFRTEYKVCIKSLLASSLQVVVPCLGAVNVNKNEYAGEPLLFFYHYYWHHHLRLCPVLESVSSWLIRYGTLPSSQPS